MFVVEALYPFSAAILKQQQSAQNQSSKQEKGQNDLQKEQKYSGDQQEGQHNENVEKSEYKQHEEVNAGEKQQADGENEQKQGQKEQQVSEISYLTFEKGEKILVLQSYENGWWYGHTIKDSDTKGFFPSNYIQTTAKPKPPPPPPAPQSQQDSENEAQGQDQQRGVDWVQNELKKITQGPVKSDYYLGIKGYKNVKIDQKNQNVLKGDHVKFDVSTGLARVPVKDQAPVAKAVRQMGYYFDYHQWNEERNKQPGHKARPDPKKKKIKKLNLKGMK